MTLFEFLMVWVCIIIGLGVAEILTGVARQIRERQSSELFAVENASPFIGFLAFATLAISRREILHSLLVPSFVLLVLIDIVPASFTIGAT